MARVSEQIREVALRVCDQLARYEDAIAVAKAGIESAGSEPPSGSPDVFSTGAADSSGAGSSFNRAPAGAGASALSIPLSVVLDQAPNVDLESLLRDAARVKSEFDEVIAAGAGVAAKRSSRDLGYAGWAQSSGDRTAVNLVQRLTGSTRVEAFRQVRLGEAMGEADAAAHPVAFPREDPSGDPLIDPDGLIEIGPDPDNPDVEMGGTAVLRPAPVVPWHAPLTQAAREGIIRTEAVTIIMRGLGAPNDRVDTEILRAAAVEMVQDAAGVNADELGFRARQIRDRIDPAGVQLRWNERHANRKWRFGRSEDGTKTAYITFEDEGAAWMESTVGAAMRPRRGGPRMVDAAEADRAEKLRLDPRSNDQIVYDTLMSALRAGVQADPMVAFGSRQPGVRVVVTQEQIDHQATDDDGDSRSDGTGYFEDSKDAVPAGMIDKQVCISGIRPVLMDTSGNALDVGREQRLFTTKQRIAMSIRDGGCRIEGCEAPPSYCESHHIDEWVAHDGRTDVADGVLLCLYHHHFVHNMGSRILRMDTEYLLLPPPGRDGERTPVAMPSKSPLERERLRLRAIETRKSAEVAAAGALADAMGSGVTSDASGASDASGEVRDRPGEPAHQEKSVHPPGIREMARV